MKSTGSYSTTVLLVSKQRYSFEPDSLISLRGSILRKALAKRRHKLTQVEDLGQLRLARACVHLRWLAMTWAHFGRDQICTQVDASFPPFGHLTQVNASWVTSINLLLANKIEDSLRVLVKKLASRLATQCTSLRKFNLSPLATTCRFVWQLA